MAYDLVQWTGKCHCRHKQTHSKDSGNSFNSGVMFHCTSPYCGKTIYVEWDDTGWTRKKRITK